MNMFIAAALSPAKINEIRLNDETKHALVIVDDDQLSLAIGKRGQNVRLASKLTGWQLDIKSKSQVGQSELTLQRVEGIGEKIVERLHEAGINTVQQLAAMTVEQLTAMKGIGDKTAQKVLEAARQALAVQPTAEAQPVAEESTPSSSPEPGPTTDVTPSGESGEPKDKEA